MALPSVTAADLKTRYPAFASVDDATVTAILTETAGAVSDTWIVADQKPAMLAYAAHLLALDGFGADKQTVTLGDEEIELAGAASVVKVGDTMIRFGQDSSTTVSSGTSSGSSSGLSTTIYGRRYLELLRRSNPPVLIV